MREPGTAVRPTIARSAWIAPGADVIGDVTIGEEASVWYRCVLRGDIAPITIGARTNVQDLTMVHVDVDRPCRIGEDVGVGHRAILHGCDIEDGCLIGMGAVLLSGSVIGAGSIVAAGAVVREGMVVPPRSLVVGVPGVVRRELNERELEILRRTPGRYLALARDTRAACLAAGHADPFQSNGAGPHHRPQPPGMTDPDAVR